MKKKTEWITPFKKQCFVTLGACLNMASQGMTVGFAAILLPQLRKADSIIPIDANSGSWIASILGFALVGGNFIVPTIMANYGRRTANIASILPMLAGWFCILFAANLPTLLAARVLQGISMGMSSSLGPVIIGEYTSPNNRGPFLASISVTIATGVLVVHTMGSFVSWQMTALVCAIIGLVDLLIVIYSPETPSWLADQGRYDESRNIFRWLRGDEEEDELQRMIETSIIIRESKVEVNSSDSFFKRIKRNLAYFGVTMRKGEFYKPIFIMMHIYTLGTWAGATIMASYTVDIFEHVVGKDSNIPLLVITMGVQRIISNTCAVFVIKKVKRRTILLVTVSINIFAFLAIAAYTYGKKYDMLPFDHPMIGVVLINIHYFTIATGTVPLPFIIAGELFPLEYRSLAGGISVLFFSGNLFLSIKTAPLMFLNIGIHGAYVIYACIVTYCLLVAWWFLPETKDRTLQDIEDEFRGRPLSPEEVKSVHSLHSLMMYKMDRRCSQPVI